MPIDLAGISNENEFYSNHYLTTAEEGPIRDRIDALAKDPSGVFETMAKAATAWNRLATAAQADRSASGRVTATREFADIFLRALGYDRIRETEKDAEDCPVPLLARVFNRDGEDALWIVEAIAPIGDDFGANALGLPFLREQMSDDGAATPDTERPIEQAVGKGVFNLDNPPRYLIVLSLAEAILVDRYKWGQGRLLRFDLGKILGRRDGHSLKVMASILHRDSIVPHAGRCLLEEIDEESHRHAHGVSAALKGAIREAIELLGNEAARLIAEKRRKSKEAIFEGENALDARELTIQCIRYMYRLLFLFYVEARPELGFAPMRSQAYRKGYALEGLRELEFVPLRTQTDRDGGFIADRLRRLFDMTFLGTEAMGLPGNRDTEGGRAEKGFSVPAVKVELFSPEAISLLAGLEFRDEVMQRIIRLLSLSDGRKGRRVGRISYAQLGVSQLGAVYETLLAFTGFFAATDLIEVRPLKAAGKSEDAAAEDEGGDDGDDAIEDDDEDAGAAKSSGSEGGDEGDPLKPAWFVPKARQGEFQPAEIVHDGLQPKVYKKGTFIYRLSGRDRQASASYYTPEPLARLLVKHALIELLEGKSADDILKLRVCEPAMGSAAFLVEVTNQLSDAYLERKQREVGKTIPQDRYAYERQKVRAFIADRNMFGVDLNPIAVELGQISLWLNCLHTDGSVPWFGDQLHAGNSLVGARRAAWSAAKLTARTRKDLWHAAGSLPREIGWKGERAKNEVWQFLVPDPTMAEYPKYVTELLDRDALDALAFWKSGEKAKKNSGEDDIPGFFDSFTAEEVKTALRLSKVVDQLFERVAADLGRERTQANDEIPIWPDESVRTATREDFASKRAHLSKLRGVGARNAPAWRRLKTAMDAWCALFFWPADKLHLLPSRADYLRDIALVLEGGLGAPTEPTPKAAPVGPRQGSFFQEELLPSRPGSRQLFEPVLVPPPEKDLFGEIDIDKLIGMSKWLPTAMEVAASERFMHFDLEFADILKERGGFDLIVGNPPWKMPIWKDSNNLGAMDPIFIVRAWSSKDVENRKLQFITSELGRRAEYLDLAVKNSGLSSFTGCGRVMPFIGSGQNNYYKCFIDLAWRLQAMQGVAAIIHQDNHLVDPKARAFRREWYSRISRHFSFRNAFTSQMFSEVAHRETFSINIYFSTKVLPEFIHISGALLVKQVDESYCHDGIGEYPEIKNSDGTWCVDGHKSRIVNINLDSLAAMRNLIEDRTIEPNEARFIAPYAQDTLELFREISFMPKCFVDGSGETRMERIWDEKHAQNSLKTIKKGASFNDSPDDIILTGPNFFVGNPIYKSTRRNGTSKSDYDVVDLGIIPDNYMPRTMFRRIVNIDEYRSKMPASKLDATNLNIDQYRIAFRKRMRSQNERTLIAALIPPGYAHVSSVVSLGFSSQEMLVYSYPAWISLPFDFVVKSSGMIDFVETSPRNFPWVETHDAAQYRALRLSCLTSYYDLLWNRHASRLNHLTWSSDDPRIEDITCPSEWARSVGLRTEFTRRLALVEIDVLVSIALGLKVERLTDMYRIHFPVLKQNEEGTWYDQQGKIVWTCSKGLPGVGYLDSHGKSPPRKVWETDFANMRSGELICEAITDFLPGGPHKVTRRFIAPFTKCDRVEDYRRAWAHFARLGVKPNKGA